MNLHNHRLAAILQVGAALAARMFELRVVRRRVQIGHRAIELKALQAARAFAGKGSVLIARANGESSTLR